MIFLMRKSEQIHFLEFSNSFMFFYKTQISHAPFQNIFRALRPQNTYIFPIRPQHFGQKLRPKPCVLHHLALLDCCHCYFSCLLFYRILCTFHGIQHHFHVHYPVTYTPLYAFSSSEKKPFLVHFLAICSIQQS